MNSTIIFDLDGTLVDSRKDLATGINLMRKDFDLPALSLETIVSYVGNGAKLLIERSLQGNKNIDLKSAIQKTKKYYKANMLNETKLYPDIREGLERLKNYNFKMAVLTNKPQEPSVAILEHLEIASFFDVIIGAGDKYPLKPEPDAIFAILKQTNCEKKDAWMIGDHNTDLEVARRAGINSCFAKYGFGHKGNESCDLEIDSLKEFVDFLR